LSKSVSACQVVPWPQDVIFWCWAIPILHSGWSGQTWLPSSGVLLKGMCDIMLYKKMCIGLYILVLWDIGL
jgi:hypothetical protein